MARRIFGTPRDQDVATGDVVGVTVVLVATDDSGSVETTATLAVSRSAPPNLSIPLSEQHLDFAPFSPPSSFIMRPDTTFDFTLASGTFTDPLGRPLTYYAVMADNSPLPAWLTFDPARLSFSGITPPLEPSVQPPQMFEFQLIASDVVGFSGASLPFSFMVGNHGLTAAQTSITLNATVGNHISYKGLAANVRLDGHDARSGGATIISTPGLPAWLEVDKYTWEIRGMPPEGAESSDFTITMEDQHLDTLNLTVSVNVMDGLFKENLPELNVTAGEHFAVDLNHYLTSSGDTELSVTTNPSSPWVEFDTDKNVISGDVPSSLASSQIIISIHARSKRTGESQSKSLNVRINRATVSRLSTISQPAAASTTDTHTSTPPTGTSTPASTSSASSQPPLPGEDDGKPTSRQTLIAILVPNLLLALILIGIITYFIRRRLNRPKPINRRDISRPIPGTFTKKNESEMTASLRELNRMYDNEHEHTPTSQLAPIPEVSSCLFSDPSLLTPPPSRGASDNSRPSSLTYTPSRRPTSARYQDDTPTRPPRGNRFSQNRFSKALNVDIPTSTMFFPQQTATPDSSTYFSNNPFPPSTSTTSSSSADRSTNLEDFIHAETIRRVPTESAEDLHPPPLALLRPTPTATPRPFQPRRLFAALPAPKIPDSPPPSPAAPRRGGPLSSSPSRYDDSPSVRSAYSATREETPSTSRSQWPVPPRRRPSVGRADSEVLEEEQSRVVEEVSELIGRALSRFSMAGIGEGKSWSVGSGEGEGGRRRRRSSLVGEVGTERSSGDDYPAFL
jgi:hypothetical protein